MRSQKNLLFCLFLVSLLSSCYEDMDDVQRQASVGEINDFIWKGMNNIYLYKADVPDLADTRFSSQKDLQAFLADFETPEDLFYNHLMASQDNFSFMTSNYVELEKALDGISMINGMQFGLIRFSGSSSKVIGYVRYVLPNTSAEENGLKRGDFFVSIDGEELNVDNYSRLLGPVTYQLGLAEMIDGELRPTREVTLTKTEYSTNPVFIEKVIPLDSKKVGYLMYNGFTSTYDSYLNQTFGKFRSEGITDLIIDLRYNGGGSVETASDLASMITGQFEGQIFSRAEWNETYQSHLEKNEPGRLVHLFNNKTGTGETINSLGLDRLYVLTTQRTASASELLINGLEPYIDVIQIGKPTTGKFQASVTLYDSPDFRRKGANPSHTYAIQPLIYKSLNANGVSDYFEGLPPDIELGEDLTNLGIIGDLNEPLLKTALDHISGYSQQSEDLYQQKRRSEAGDVFEFIGESGMDGILYQKMYLEKVPKNLHLVK